MNQLMDVLIPNMAIAVSIDFLVMLVLWAVTIQQKAVTPLGKWLNIFLFLNALFAAIITGLVFALRNIDPGDANHPFERVLVLAIYIIPVGRVLSGIMLIKWSLTGEPANEQQSQFEKG